MGLSALTATPEELCYLLGPQVGGVGARGGGGGGEGVVSGWLCGKCRIGAPGRGNSVETSGWMLQKECHRETEVDPRII